MIWSAEGDAPEDMSRPLMSLAGIFWASRVCRNPPNTRTTIPNRIAQQFHLHMEDMRNPMREIKRNKEPLIGPLHLDHSSTTGAGVASGLIRMLEARFLRQMRDVLFASGERLSTGMTELP